MCKINSQKLEDAINIADFCTFWHHFKVKYSLNINKPKNQDEDAPGKIEQQQAFSFSMGAPTNQLTQTGPGAIDAIASEKGKNHQPFYIIIN